ncbi:MAG TPA: FecR domain-containing protein [Blastocatellia bacterium]|nr:FecR domain-containing protein [Blastocatellia bacterium]
MRLTRIAVMAMLILGGTGSALAQERIPLSAQERNHYVVSAKAGAVNIVEGDVTFKGKNGAWDMLVAGDDLNNGNRVKTGADGRIEILLNPGSYLRLSEDTEIVFLDTMLSRLKIAILNGSAYIEAAMVDGQSGNLVTVITPQSEFCIVKGGLYRFNVTGDKRSEAIVRKGKLMVPGGINDASGKKEWLGLETEAGKTLVQATAINEGKKVILETNEVSIAAFDKKVEDEFDLWSKDRAKMLIAANQKLARHARRGLISSNVWVFNPFFGSYSFLPGYYGFSSPYGWGYRVCNNPSWAAGRGNSYPGNSGWGGSNSGSGSGGGSGSGTGAGTGRGSGGGTGSGSGSSAGGAVNRGSIGAPDRADRAPVGGRNHRP